MNLPTCKSMIASLALSEPINVQNRNLVKTVFSLQSILLNTFNALSIPKAFSLHQPHPPSDRFDSLDQNQSFFMTSSHLPSRPILEPLQNSWNPKRNFCHISQSGLITLRPTTNDPRSLAAGGRLRDSQTDDRTSIPEREHTFG